MKKKQYFLKINDYSQYVKRIHKKVKTVGIISRSYVKNVKQASFNRLAKLLFISTKPNPVKQLNETKQFQQKLNDMKS